MEDDDYPNTSNFSNCSLLYDSTNYKVLAGLRAGVGLVSALCCIAVITIIILLKKYKLFSQRLILNIAVAALIHSLSYTTARVNYYTVRPIEDPYCYFGGLFNHYTAAVELISIWFAAINIFSVGFCRKNISRCEGVYYVLTYSLPSLWFWVPVWLEAYGTAGGWCGLRTLNEDCKDFPHSRYIEFGVWYIPLYVSTAVIVAMLIAVPLRMCCSLRHWGKHHDPVKQAAKNLICIEIRPLIVYPIIYLLLNTFSFVSQIYNAIHPRDPSVVLPYLRVLSSPLRGAFIALVFALDRDTWRRLRAGQWRRRWKARDERSVDMVESTTLYSSKEEDKLTSKYNDYDDSPPE